MGSDASSAPSGPKPRLQPGDTIDGKYLVVGVLGAGGMGIVFEAEHLRLKQRCAIKMLSAAMLEESELVHRFEREARASALLKSPHVTRVTDVATTAEGVPYIVMELMAGRDLDSELSRRGRLPYAEAVDYVLQACAAVAEAHGAGIIHRDLKPGNLFLAQEEERVIVKVLDFGISKMMADESKLTMAGSSMGTALYMSPEQLRSAAKVDARSDIWSLGIILYELIVGDPPFVGNGPQVAAAIVSDDPEDITRRALVPAELGGVIHRALQRPPDARFQTIDELAAALAPFAPPQSVGSAVAAQIARRAAGTSSPKLVSPRAVDQTSGLGADLHGGGRAEARDVSTIAAHEVNTSASVDRRSRKTLVAVVGVALIVLVIGGGILMRAVLRPLPVGHMPAAAASTDAEVTTSATAETEQARDASGPPAPPAPVASSVRPTATATAGTGTAPRPARPSSPATPAPAVTPSANPKKPHGAPSAIAPPFL